MPLIKSISGIRGTIGGTPGNNLTPLDILKFSAAYGIFIKQNNPGPKCKIIVGRDSRISGPMVNNLVVGTLLGQGIEVIDLGLASTPTVEIAVSGQAAQGGIILTASHNPQGWNALKLLDAQGEFLSAVQGEEVLRLAGSSDFEFVGEEKLGTYFLDHSAGAEHLHRILKLKLVDKDLIAKQNFKIVVDGINSVGGIIVPKLLRELGVKNIVELNCEPSGKFAHRPEPLAENLIEIRELVKESQADLGIVVDPDVDRLAFLDERGEMFGEEYTLVAVAQYILQNYKMTGTEDGNQYNKATVSNLSSSRALKDLSESYQGEYRAAAVGEVNVVAKMKETKAVIGGEGNGGIIYPELHYGRDALVGIALFLTSLAKAGKKVSKLRQELPEYYMVKDKLELPAGFDLSGLLLKIKQAYQAPSQDNNPEIKLTDIDGLKIDWLDSWIHLRASNTEPIMRIYAEAKSLSAANQKIKEIKDKILAYIK